MGTSNGTGEVERLIAAIKARDEAIKTKTNEKEKVLSEVRMRVESLDREIALAREERGTAAKQLQGLLNAWVYDAEHHQPASPSRPHTSRNPSAAGRIVWKDKARAVRDLMLAELVKCDRVTKETLEAVATRYQQADKNPDQYRIYLALRGWTTEVVTRNGSRHFDLVRPKELHLDPATLNPVEKEFWSKVMGGTA